MAAVEIKDANEFVKREQEKLAAKGAKDAAMLRPDMLKMNGNMTNTGEYAKECAKRLTEGMSDAFPRS